MATEDVILWCIAVVMWLGLICWILWGVEIVRTIARWLGAQIARVWFGDVERGRK